MAIIILLVLIFNYTKYFKLIYNFDYIKSIYSSIMRI